MSELDSLEALTELVHRAYRQLADQGFRYWGTYQSVDDTRLRISRGECYVACVQGVIVATVVLKNPQYCNGHPWYDRPDVASFNQFAVDPSFQKQGVGSHLLTVIERHAEDFGAHELACDTAEGAAHLIKRYTKRGFREVGRVIWDGDNFESLVFSKTLAEPGKHP